MESSFVPTPSPFTCDTFTPHVGDPFAIAVVGPEGNEETIDLELIGAEPTPLKPHDGRALGQSGYVRTDPFSLLFRGPADKMLVQGSYAFRHAVIGELEMVIVPVGPGETGLLYQATFN